MTRTLDTLTAALADLDRQAAEAHLEAQRLAAAAAHIEAARAAVRASIRDIEAALAAAPFAPPPPDG